MWELQSRAGSWFGAHLQPTVIREQPVVCTPQRKGGQSEVGAISRAVLSDALSPSRPGFSRPGYPLCARQALQAMIVLFWSRATRDLLKSFGWGIAALHRLDAATKLPFPRRPPHSVFRFPNRSAPVKDALAMQQARVA